METLLEVENLKVYHKTPTVPVRAVDGVSFTVTEKEILGVAGESGCGKSTLATGLLKLISPSTYIAGGKVLFHGQDLIKMDEEELRKIRWNHIALFPQSSMNSLNPVMKIFDQLIDAMEAHGIKKSKTDFKNDVIRRLKSVSLPPEISSGYECQLSGGMKQRVIISMGMLIEPDLIIADEPTSSLDVIVQRGVLELFSDIRKELKTSVILISHDISILAEVVDRLAIFYAGKIVEIQAVHDIFKDPLHPYTCGLMDSIPTFEKKEIPSSIVGLPPDLRDPPQGCRFHPRCSKVMEICKHKEPEYKEVEPRKFVACHLY